MTNGDDESIKYQNTAGTFPLLLLPPPENGLNYYYYYYYLARHTRRIANTRLMLLYYYRRYIPLWRLNNVKHVRHCVLCEYRQLFRGTSCTQSTITRHLHSESSFHRNSIAP